jgi:hypothetical protein
MAGLVPATHGLLSRRLHTRTALAVSFPHPSYLAATIESAPPMDALPPQLDAITFGAVIQAAEQMGANRGNQAVIALA